MVFVKNDNRSWLNIIKLCWNSHKWSSKTAFKTSLFSLILEKQEAEITGIFRRKESKQETKLGKNQFAQDEEGKEKIRKIINSHETIKA